MVASTRLVVPILVDCSDKGSNEDLQTKYGVRGYPTVVYVDPEGNKLKDMGTREAAPLAKEIEGVAAKFPGRPSIWQNSTTGALAAAKKQKKPLPVAVYVAEEGADLLKLTAKLMKDLGSRKTKFLYVLERGKPALERWGLEAAPAVVILDPTAEDPRAAPVAKVPIAADAKPDVLNKALDEAAKKK